MQLWDKASVDNEKAKELSKSTGLNAEALRLLISRGFDTAEKINELLNPSELCNPFDIIDMEKAADRIEQAMDGGERICVYGDYDADGVTATAVLMLYFAEKEADAFYYIPNRHTEGYGMNADAIRSIKEKGTQLIVSVDNGISAIDEAKLINELGMDLVVTDHHRPGAEIPSCIAVVDPHRSENKTSFRHWCGAGIAFKLVCAMEDKSLKLNKLLSDTPGSLRRGMSSNATGALFPTTDSVSEMLLDKYCDILAVGTIGDVVSLTGENRYIVKRGLQKLNHRRNVNNGLAALMNAASVRLPLDSHGVAFSIVPKINAVGRLDTADAAVELLLCESDVSAVAAAQAIVGYNNDRQKFGREIEDDIERYIAGNPESLNERVLFFSGEGWHDGLIGIVAARYSELYGKPCLIVTYDEQNAKGSGRSIEGFSLFECISSCSKLLDHYGGHPMAAGFSLKTEDLKAFHTAVEAYAAAVEMPFLTLKIDDELADNMVSIAYLDSLEALEPFGEGNEEPVFSLSGQTLSSVRFVGKDKNHARMTFDGLAVPVMKFRVTGEEFPFKEGDKLDLAVTLSKNEFNGSVSVSISCKDIRFSSLNDKKFLRSERGYEKFRLNEPLEQRQKEFMTPSRDYIGAVYRFIKSNGGWQKGVEALCARTGDDGSHICRLLAALDILAELGIILKNGEKIYLPKDSIKADLEKSEILKRLNG